MLFVFLFLFAVPPGSLAATFSDFYRAGLVALQAGDLMTAKTNLMEACRLEPKNGGVWIALSRTFWKLNDSANAQQAAENAAAFGATDRVVLGSLAVYYSESGQPLKAAEFQSRVASLDPTDTAAVRRAAELYFEAAQPLLEQERFADALATLRGYKLSKNAQIELALGVACYGLRRFGEAAQGFFNAIALDPNAKQPYLFLGRMLDEIPDRLPEATARFIEFEKANPTSYEGYYLHAKALDAAALNAESSRKLLQKAIALNGGIAAVHSELGMLLEGMRLYSEAAVEFEAASSLEPADAATHYRLSRVYDRLGKTQAAATERTKHRDLITAQNAKR